MPMTVGVPAPFYSHSPQWRIPMRFMLKLCHSSEPVDGPVRYVDRPASVDAADDAFRWLRLHRNTHRMFAHRYDRWEVWILDLERGYRRVTFGGPLDNPK